MLLGFIPSYGSGLWSNGPKGAGLPLGGSQKIFLLQGCKVSFKDMSIFGFLPSCNSQKAHNLIMCHMKEIQRNQKSPHLFGRKKQILYYNNITTHTAALQSSLTVLSPKAPVILFCSLPRIRDHRQLISLLQNSLSTTLASPCLHSPSFSWGTSSVFRKMAWNCRELPKSSEVMDLCY